jgi:hypothetical protein
MSNQFRSLQNVELSFEALLFRKQWGDRNNNFGKSQFRVWLTEPFDFRLTRQHNTQVVLWLTNRSGFQLSCQADYTQGQFTRRNNAERSVGFGQTDRSLNQHKRNFILREGFKYKCIAVAFRLYSGSGNKIFLENWLHPKRPKEHLHYDLSHIWKSLQVYLWVCSAKKLIRADQHFSDYWWSSGWNCLRFEDNRHVFHSYLCGLH